MKIYRTGEIVPDIGIVHFKNILNQMKLDNIELTSNYLYLPKIEIHELIQFLWKNIFEKDYVPYIRNSPKFGSNSVGEREPYVNFRKNLEEQLNIILELLSSNNNANILKQYGPTKKCSICNRFHGTEYDINNKKQWQNKEKERKISKYIYSFLGSENNTFSNYTNRNIEICFVCEFLVVLFLSYIDKNENRYLVYSNNLQLLDFINYKSTILSELNDVGILRKLSDFNNYNMKIYRTTIDRNKGVILDFVKNLDVKKIKNTIRNIALINEYNTNWSNKENLKKEIFSENYNQVKSFFLNNINDENIFNMAQNLSVYLKYIGGNDMSEEYQGWYKKGLELGKNVISGNKDKKAIQKIAFKLINLLQSMDRSTLLDEIMHLFVVNNMGFPYKVSNIIMEKDKDELHYAVGKLIEGLLNTNQGGSDE